MSQQAPIKLITTPDDWAREGLHLGDCREILRDLDDDSIDAGRRVASERSRR